LPAHDYGAAMANNDIVMLEGGPLIDPAALEDALGWALKPEGHFRKIEQ
jgi:hypothetical protein